MNLSLDSTPSSDFDRPTRQRSDRKMNENVKNVKRVQGKTKFSYKVQPFEVFT